MHKSRNLYLIIRLFIKNLFTSDPELEYNVLRRR